MVSHSQTFGSFECSDFGQITKLDHFISIYLYINFNNPLIYKWSSLVRTERLNDFAQLSNENFCPITERYVPFGLFGCSVFGQKFTYENGTFLLGIRTLSNYLTVWN